MLITDIVEYDKRRSKVLMEEGLTLLLYKGEIRKLRLSKGDDISSEYYIEFIIPLLTKRAWERIIYILKNADKSERDIRKKLHDGFYPDEVIDAVITKAKEHRYIDDTRYAQGYLRYHSAGKSKRRVIYDLKLKGIDKETIEEVLNDMPVDEESHIIKELSKKRYDPETTDKETAAKLMAALVRKGFSYELVKKAMKQYDEN